MLSHSHAACIYSLDSFLFNLQGLTHYTHLLLHKPTFTPTSFYTNTLLHKALFAETHFYTNQLLQPSFHAHYFFGQPTFCTIQLYTTPALGLKAKGQRAGGMPKAVKYL